MERRAIILTTVIVFCFGVVFWRLIDIMLLNHDRYASRAITQQTQEIEIRKRRGIVYDRRGKELAANIEQQSLYCDPLKLGSVYKTAYRLSGATGVNRKSLIKKIKNGKRFVWVKRKVDNDTARRIEKFGLDGVGFIPESERVYPGNRLASHILGFVDIDNKGLAGIELKYDKYLAAPGGKIRVTTDAKRNILLSGDELESIGSSVVLTVDEVLQYIAESALDSAVKQWSPKSASVIMMNPYSGEILAMANRPAFDPNNVSRSRTSTRRNMAITDVYEPGSTFKVVTASGVLEENIFSLKTRFDCSQGFIQLGKTKIRDEHRHKILTFSEVIQKSSNVGTILMAQRLGEENLYKYARKFGFGETTGIDLPGEVSGWVKDTKNWSNTSIGAMSIGHEVAVTPLQVVRAYAAIANNGYLVEPFVVSKIISPEGIVLYEKQMGSLQRVISEDTSEKVRGMLELVTMEGGTAVEASVEGNTVAGKTGTAQVYDIEKGKYSHDRYVSSFVGFFPSHKPKLVMIVVISEPEGEHLGGRVAGPVFREIAEKALAYLQVPMEKDQTENIIHVSAQGEAQRYY